MRVATFSWVLAGIGVSPAAFPLDCTMVPGWELHRGPDEYTADNLFDYMDGNAEGYLIYDFQRLTTVTCVAGEKRVVVDVSEMATPEMAYGMFLSARHPRRPLERMGTVGQVTPRRVAFAKDRYYVEVMGSGAEDLESDLRAFAAALEGRISGTAEPPPEPAWFPEEGRKEGSLRMVPQSVLGLRELPFGYVAEYEFGRLFLVRTATAEEAGEALQALRGRLEGPTPLDCADEGVTGSGQYLGQVRVCRKGRYLVGAARIADEVGAAAAVGDLLGRVP
ncbi:MAG: hypothetical protein Kow00109_06500 [Acidobacteriota bacterium]